VPETHDLPEQQSEKRQRVNEEEQEQSQPFEKSQDHRDMVQYFVEQLGTPPAAITDALTKEIRSAHTKFLDLRRQIAAIKEKMDNKVNPHGWKIIPVPLGIANAALEQLILDEQNLAAQKCLQHIKDAKEADAQLAYSERGAAITRALDRHQASVERMLTANSDRYIDVNGAAVMEHATVILASLSITAEVNADLAYDRKAQARADKQLLFTEKLAAEKTQQPQPPSNADDAATIIQQLRTDVAKLMKGQNQKPQKKPQPKPAAQPGSKKASNGQKPVSRAKKPTGGSNTARGKNSNANSNSKRSRQQPQKQHKQQNRQASPTAVVTKRAVINLSPLPAPPSLVSALGLGPSFRPSPPPLRDESIVKALRHFSTRVKTAAFFVLFPREKQHEYIPKLYTPTNTACDPDSAALDHCLDQYQSTITTAMSLSATAANPSNMSKGEVTALRDLQAQLREGTAQHIPLPADKDRAFTLVSQSQHTAVWEKAMSGSQYTLVEPDSIDWKAVVRAVRMAADRALKGSIISPSGHVQIHYPTLHRHCQRAERQLTR
jgi:hypothetical protein